jgi:hypothetical protein
VCRGKRPLQYRGIFFKSYPGTLNPFANSGHERIDLLHSNYLLKIGEPSNEARRIAILLARTDRAVTVEFKKL